ncbi:UDP-N-acetylmuramate dehydrogenase [Ningiella sp. W23]|uniref:UDP-N-acetylmuramate dehydrogenase n=1 Tax=Ningiella sp. W23 TaxID=3023715 RepID=UPI0037567A8A
MTVDSVDSLLNAVQACKDKALLFIGEGSNTVFVEDFDGIVIQNQLKGIQISEDDERYFLSVASGENWHDLVCLCMEKGIYGFENLALIPGTVGACPIQNIGAYGVEIEKFIHSVEFFDTHSEMMGYFNHKECEFAYRESRFKQSPGKRIITMVNFVLPKAHVLVTDYGPLAQLIQNGHVSPKDVFNKVIEVRQSKLPDPATLGNAGSFFKNPTLGIPEFLSLQSKFADIPHYNVPDNRVKVPAAWLIDQLGYKGKTIGDIGCHEHQALVLVNHASRSNGGKGEDLLALARQIKGAVENEFGIILENEVRLIGANGLVNL